MVESPAHCSDAPPSVLRSSREPHCQVRKPQGQELTVNGLPNIHPSTMMSPSINHLSINTAQDLISSCTITSATLNKLLPVKICGFIAMGLVNSGNSFYNAISLAVAKRIGLTYHQSYNGPPVGTASVGSSLDIVRLTFSLTDESGSEHKLTLRLVIVKHLSCGLNISLPFLVEHGLDQLHSQGILSMTQKNVRFPIDRNLNQARWRLKVEKIETPRISGITFNEGLFICED